MKEPPQPAKGKRPVYLIGDPVDHSLSPIIHNAAFRARNVDLEYVPWHVERGDVGDALARLHESGAVGANVTVPHKQVVHDLLDDLSETATSTGAVNTLVRTSKGWHGENTDVEGFLAPLREARLDFEWRLPAGRQGTALILGAGGAAHAVAVALLEEYAFEHIVVAARRVEQAEALCTNLSGVGDQGPGGRGQGGASLQSWPLESVADVDAQVIVNATPVGMHPYADKSPLPEAFDFQGVDVAYDLIYNPPETEFLRRARDSGAHTINGLQMLIAQAAASFRLWTDQEMNLQVVESVLASSS